MYLKRFYKKPEDWVKEVNTRDPETKRLKRPDLPEGVCLNPPPLDCVVVAHTGTTPEQNFSAGLVSEAIAAGTCTISKGQLILHVLPEDLVYTIKRAPGRYCSHCGETLPDDGTGELARGHVATNHAGIESPDPSHPSGYCWLTYYECVLNAEQHEKYRAKEPGKPPVFRREVKQNG